MKKGGFKPPFYVGNWRTENYSLFIHFFKNWVVVNKKSRPLNDSETVDNKKINGGADGTRTRDLQRDRLAF